MSRDRQGAVKCYRFLTIAARKKFAEETVSFSVPCPRCGKTFERREGQTTCPHCSAAEAIAVLKEHEPVPAVPATAITAHPLPDGSVTCPRCGKRFDAPGDPQIPWLSCPFCHEVNSDALVNRTATQSNGHRALGYVLLITGFLAITVGSFLTCIGMTLVRHGEGPTELIDVVVVAIWVLGSLAVIITGIFLVSARPAPARQGNYWGPGAFFLILMLVGFAGWIFAFTTCSFFAP